MLLLPGRGVRQVVDERVAARPLEVGEVDIGATVRVELVREGFPARLILAVGKHLRVSEEVLDEDDAGELYVYKATMSPRAILERLERPRGR